MVHENVLDIHVTWLERDPKKVKEKLEERAKEIEEAKKEAEKKEKGVQEVQFLDDDDFIGMDKIKKGKKK